MKTKLKQWQLLLILQIFSSKYVRFMAQDTINVLKSLTVSLMAAILACLGIPTPQDSTKGMSRNGIGRPIGLFNQIIIVIPIELLLISYTIPEATATHISSWLLIVDFVSSKHDFQLKMHRKAYGGLAVMLRPNPLGNSQSHRYPDPIDGFWGWAPEGREAKGRKDRRGRAYTEGREWTPHFWKLIIVFGFSYFIEILIQINTRRRGTDRPIG